LLLSCLPRSKFYVITCMGQQAMFWVIDLFLFTRFLTVSVIIMKELWNCFVHPDDRALVFDRYQKRIRGEDVIQNYDFRVVGKGGLMTWVQISAVRITQFNRAFEQLTGCAAEAMIGQPLDELFPAESWVDSSIRSLMT